MDTPKKILMVNDSESAWLAASYALRENGFDIMYVNSVEKAAMALRENAFDLVVTDFSMGGLYADDLIGEVNAHNKRTGTRTGMIVSTLAPDIDHALYNTLRRPHIEMAIDPIDERKHRSHSLRLKSAPFPVQVLTYWETKGKPIENVIQETLQKSRTVG